jgi:integrase
VSVSRSPGGAQYRARAWFRDFDGLRRMDERDPRTEWAARTALETALVRSALDGSGLLWVDRVALRQDLFDLSAFLLATGLRIGEALAVLWRDVDLDLGVLRVTSTLTRVTRQGLLRKCTKSQPASGSCSCRSGA